MLRIALVVCASVLAIWSSSSPAADIPSAVQPLAYQLRWEGGPLELVRRQSLGLFPLDNPSLEKVITRWYDPSTVEYLKDVEVDAVWLTWSIGLAPQEEEIYDATLAAYIARCHQASIRVLATISAGHCLSRVGETLTRENGILKDPHGKKVDCLASGVPTLSLQCYQADLRDADWKAQVLNRSLAAIRAGADGIVLDDLWSPRYDAKLAANFANAVQESLTRRGAFDKDRTSTTNQSIVPVIPILARNFLGESWTAPWLVLKMGTWPGVRSSLASLEGGEVVVAGASQTPWINSNLGVLHVRQILSADRPFALAYLDNSGNLDPANPISRGFLPLAVAEAAAFSTASVLRLDDTLRQGLAAREPQSIEQWKTLKRYFEFFKHHRGVMKMKPVANIMIAVKDWDHSAEMLNLMSRRRLLYDVVSMGQLSKTLLEPYALLIVEPSEPLVPDVLDNIIRFMDHGGMVVTNTTNLTSKDRLPTFHKIEETSERTLFSVGKGKWVIYQPTFPDPDSFASEIKTLLGRDQQPVRMWNASTVLCNLAQSVDTREEALHLFNYGIEPVEELQVQVNGSFHQGLMLAPDLPEPVSLRLSFGTYTTEFTIPRLNVYGLVLLQ